MPFVGMLLFQFKIAIQNFSLYAQVYQLTVFAFHMKTKRTPTIQKVWNYKSISICNLSLLFCVQYNMRLYIKLKCAIMQNIVRIEGFAGNLTLTVDGVVMLLIAQAVIQHQLLLPLIHRSVESRSCCQYIKHEIVRNIDEMK